ncbi:hypothetical protein PVAND_011194 [Polypedilum vanderplanki]|uniref:Gamma-interferon inducible lysosomal thiol reductase n=1 Tax=Polypedilum vanderplanki TaxID=319348 RepID=A0A9J6CHU5_POLVA|nr:hypothetical protein PVAND_011194 [Polypedilum vanderplanki]
MKLWIAFVLFTINICITCMVKVKMDIYYESLCPDSIRFINQQLYPLYNEFKDNLDITFIPHGKSNSYQGNSGEIEFECQHGPDECFGNKVQGCMLARIRDQDTQVSYVACQMQFGADRTHQACVEAFGVSWNEILQCVGGEFATKQQLGFERVTTPVLRTTNWVPSIVYNNQITDYTHSGNSPPLKDVICSLISNTNSACLEKYHF